MTGPVRARRRWRWLRLVIPFAVVFAVLVGTGVTHAMAQPDVSDTNFLNPGSGAAIGGRDLADLLRQGGTAVQRVTSSSDALLAAYRGDVTLFIPAPSLMHPYYLRMLKLLPESTRVVLVEPSSLTLVNGHVPADALGSRWATKAVDPGCGLPEASAAGRAAIYATHYAAAGDRQTASCYAGALVGLRVNAAEVLLAGASDPFRNDRIREYRNAALATGLLRTHPTLIWLDLHRREAQPGVVHQPGQQNQPAAPPSLGDGGSPDPDFPVPVAPSRSAEAGNAPGGPLGGGDRPNPLWSAFPPWMWMLLVLLGLIAIVLAMAFGRRLGPPVSEPLPVAVRAAETVQGRGRLYRRAKARGPALQALRDAARHRLLPALGLEPDAAPALLTEAVTARTGRTAGEVEAILYGPEPADDAALVQAVADLDRLLHETLGI